MTTKGAELGAATRRRAKIVSVALQGGWPGSEIVSIAVQEG
jgi:hypothetical protein